MTEKTVVKDSMYVYLVGMIIAIILGVILKMISIPIGFTIGFLINLVIFYLIIKMSEVILKTNRSTMIVVVMYIVKMMVYASGFLLAIWLPNIINLFAVFAGYLVTNITISIEPILKRGGKE